MPKVLQINVTANSGSTGRIAEQINQSAASCGWETYFAYGRNMQPCKSKLIHVGNMLQVYEHYAEHRLFDNDGLASRLSTLKLVREIKKIKPDIIHLHNIHDHWLNYKILFEYLNTLDIPIVWTQHDCWSFTGGCKHFTLRRCYRWRDGGCTRVCPQKKQMMLCRSSEKTDLHYCLKKKLFGATKNLTLVPVSNWLEGLERQSFLQKHNIVTIHNGIDISKFQPTDGRDIARKYGIGDAKYVIGVSGVWLPYKGWNDFNRLATMLPDDVRLVLVGLNKRQVEEAERNGIVGIPRTENIYELAALYSGAVMFCNLTYEDTYPTTNLEAMACGTPVLTYRTGGSVEAVSDGIGWIVEPGNVNEVSKLITDWMSEIDNNPDVELEMRKKCRNQAVSYFNREDRFADYLNLYEKLLEKS